jgi:hypothetical protein
VGNPAGLVEMKGFSNPAAFSFFQSVKGFLFPHGAIPAVEATIVKECKDSSKHFPLP